MVFHSGNLLVILVPFTGYKYHVALIGHHAGCLYGFPPVCNGYNLSALRSGESGRHVVYYCLRVFKTWVVACYNNPVTTVCSFGGHKRAFALVAVSSGAAHGYYLAFEAAAFL